MDFSQINLIKETLAMPVAPLDDTSFPVALGLDGWPIDPTTIVHIRLPKPGEPMGLDSIFDVPPGPYDRVKNVTVQEQLELLYQHGFRGRVIFNLNGPHPLSKPKKERVSQVDRYPRTECRICTAFISGDEKMHGYTMLELRHAGMFGCPTCSVLYRGIRHFATLLVLDYEDWESKVNQETIKESKLLAQSNEINVRLEKQGKYVAQFKLVCDGQLQSSGLVRTPHYRIMDTSSYATVELVKEWLRTCSKEHEDCIIPGKTILPSRLLEVSNHRVKLYETKGEIGAYLALSHCWGNNPIIKTESTNIEERKMDIPWNSLSKTFQDAINFTWRLGYRYLWVDSLCIMQDDKKDWEINASKMAQIFSNAQLTISATRSADGSGGCFSLRSQEPFRFTRQGQAKEIHNPDLWEPYRAAANDRDGIAREFFMRIKPIHGVEESPLLQRAWVFQEQILSPRIIHFAVGELYWECKSYVTCECTGWEKRSETLQLETRRRKAHGQLVGCKASLRQPSPASPEKERQRDFEAYKALVEQYTATRITKDQDCLPALSGVTFGRRDEYLAGMWRSMLAESLLWATKRSAVHSMAYRPHKYRAPSWSWASVASAIRHVDGGDLVANVLSAACTPDGTDPRGRLVSGYLKIQGPVVRVKVHELGVRDDPGPHESDSYAVLRLGGLDEQCDLDTSAPVEVQVGDEVLCLRISAHAALILRGIEDMPGAYRRIGISKMEEESSGRWYFEAQTMAVFIM